MSLEEAETILDETEFASESNVVAEVDVNDITNTIFEEVDKPAPYTETQIEEGRVFLEKYGINTSNLAPQDVFEKLQKIQNAKEEAAQVLSRGRALDGINRLLSFVPTGFTGGFFGENDIDVRRAEALGWEVLIDEDANKQSSTGASDNRVRLGDQVLMIIPEENYVGNLLAKAERFKKRRASRDPSNASQGDEVMGADPLFPIQNL